MKKQIADKEKTIVSLMLEIDDFLMSNRVDGTSVDRISEKDLGFLYWKQTPLMNDQRKCVREQMDTVIKLITEHNPQISEFSIYQELLFGITKIPVWWGSDEATDIESKYKKAVNDLLSYTATREIRIPIINLEVPSKPLKFGLVTFFRIKESDKKGKLWTSIQTIAGKDQDKVCSYAKIRCPGDSQRAFEYANKVTSKTLNILRAIGLPIDSDINFQFGLINEYIFFQTRPFEVKLIEESFDLRLKQEIVRVVGRGVTICNLQKDILKLMKPSLIKNLSSLLENEFDSLGGGIKRKFFLGLHWIGETTKPDTNESKFAKLAFALEAFIGGDAKDKNLSTRGLTATLAERAAFIVGGNPHERKDIHDQIFSFYEIRSGIVHGGSKKITQNQLSDSGSLIRRIAWAMLIRLDDFNNIDDLQAWVLKQRYS